MWMLTPEGMFSAVAATDEPDLVVVRTRVKADVEALHQWLRKIGAPSEVLAYKHSDYPWRTVTTKIAWGFFCQKSAEDIDYPNFKAEVARVQGSKRADVYALVWEDLLALEGLDPDRRRSFWHSSAGAEQ